MLLTAVDIDKAMGKVAGGEGGRVVSLALPKVPMKKPLWGNCTRTSAGHLSWTSSGGRRQLAMDPAKEAKEGCLLGMGDRSQVCILLAGWLYQ